MYAGDQRTPTRPPTWSSVIFTPAPHVLEDFVTPGLCRARRSPRVVDVAEVEAPKPPRGKDGP